MTKNRDIRSEENSFEMLILRVSDSRILSELTPSSLICSVVYFSDTNAIISSTQVHITLDPATKVSKVLAFVKFAKGTAAVEAFETLDKTSFQGRLLHILPAIDRKGTSENLNSTKNSVKSDKDKKRKESATREFNWSMLYMNVRLPPFNLCVEFI